MEKKQNCWEYFKCGREPGGLKTKELGVCPIPKESRLNTVHNGKNAGRACWVVSGSLCDGKVQGNFASKLQKCMKCEFYKKVVKEEKGNFYFATNLIKMLKSKK